MKTGHESTAVHHLTSERAADKGASAPELLRGEGAGACGQVYFIFYFIFVCVWTGLEGMSE